MKKYVTAVHNALKNMPNNQYKDLQECMFGDKKDDNLYQLVYDITMTLVPNLDTPEQYSSFMGLLFKEMFDSLSKEQIRAYVDADELRNVKWH